MKVLLLLIPLLLSLTGCSGLIVRDTDSPAATTGKVVTRMLIGVPTFGFSELALYEVKQNEQRAQEQIRYRVWFQSLAPDAQQRELDRRSAQQAAALYGLGLGLSGGGPMHPYTSQRHAPVMPMPGNCWSPVVGQGLMTQCY